jgi:ABC-type sugar transport system ATPase subunit
VPALGGFEGRVYVAEPTGNVQYVTIDVQGVRLLAQVEPSCEESINKDVYCSFREGRTYLFDRQTGRTLD